MSEEPTSNRSRFRVEYPPQDCPRLVVGKTEHEVLNCSETGLLFRVSGKLPTTGDLVSGRVHFRAGGQAWVSGSVVRVIDRDVALALSGTGIPFATVMAEQRYLRNRYVEL